MPFEVAQAAAFYSTIVVSYGTLGLVRFRLFHRGDALLALVLCAKSATASADASAAADALFRQGRLASERGDAAAACVYFADSYKLEPTVGTLLNLASCSKVLGRTATALSAYKEALDRMGAGDDRRGNAGSERLRLESLAPRVTLTLAEPACHELSVTLDAKPLPVSALGVSFVVDPGAHEVQLRCAGFETSMSMYTARDGEASSLALRRGKALAFSTKSVVPAVPPALRSSHTWSWVALGTGGTLVAAGAVSGILLLQDASTVKSDCDASSRLCFSQAGEDAKTRGRTLEWTTPISLGAGAVLSSIGAYGLLFGGTSGSARSQSLIVAPQSIQIHAVF